MDQKCRLRGVVDDIFEQNTLIEAKIQFNIQFGFQAHGISSFAGETPPKPIDIAQKSIFTEVLFDPLVELTICQFDGDLKDL